MKVMGLLTLLLATVLVSACVRSGSVSYGDDHRHYDGGPPPHAPAHGYRAKHRHQNMVYDSRLGAYVVLGYSDHYFHNDWYFRYRDGLWQINANLSDRDWRDVDFYRVPEGLRNSKRGKHSYKDYPGKGKGKEKHKDRY
jgi:hypothetical protein